MPIQYYPLFNLGLTRFILKTVVDKVVEFTTIS